MQSPTFKQQFEKKYTSLKVITKFEVIIDKSTFYDDDSDTLTYSLNFAINNVSTSVPSWFEFDHYLL